MHSILYLLVLLLCNFSLYHTKGAVEKLNCAELDLLDEASLRSLIKVIVPDFEKLKRKGESGKILVIGGSIEYTGAPYFAAISALKAGADLVHVITTDVAAPVIKSYSPDLIVHPIRNLHSLSKINALLPKIHVVVIGPGLGRENDDIKMFSDIIETCRTLKKPLVIDADGLYALSKNVSVLKDYPSPGAILTPNQPEAKRLEDAMPFSDVKWTDYWGAFVSVLQKGEEDQYHSSLRNVTWLLSGIGSNRRAGGQGDILAGSLATFLHWAIEANICENYKLGQSLAAYAAAKFTRTCNYNAFTKHGRSMTASDMINEIHPSFVELFV